jgi:ribonucleotide reductase alpha subunit
MLFKDSCNSKSNQKNLGCIKSSNLCAEIIIRRPKKRYLAHLSPQMVDIGEDGQGVYQLRQASLGGQPTS